MSLRQAEYGAAGMSVPKFRRPSVWSLCYAEFHLVDTVRKIWRGFVNAASRKHPPGRRVLLPYIEKTLRFDTFAAKDGRNVHQPRQVRPLYFRFGMSEENQLSMDAPA